MADERPCPNLTQNLPVSTIRKEALAKNESFFAFLSALSRFPLQTNYFQKNLKFSLKKTGYAPLIKVTLRELLGFPRRRKPLHRKINWRNH
ncbi:hypothetical protein R7070_12585, partial [Vibrio sp. 1557]|uniref:hypothetical protein n=1 Tax=Vibrio sp. 1557 TaxID=3074561 RepID=UPI002964A2E6